jgi:hypothetical protein
MNCILCANKFDNDDSTGIEQDFFHVCNDSDAEHENMHYMCIDCMETVLMICACDKELNKEPDKAFYICPCADSVYEPVYIDIDTDAKRKSLEKYLTQFKDNIYGIPCCRGCKYTKKDIQKNINIGLKAAIDYCMYKQTDDGFEYQGDSLDESYVLACEKLGWSIGTPVDL